MSKTLLDGKKAVNEKAACDMQEQYPGKPHGWVQWKGTDVCMDVYCACGHHSHIDAGFAYNVECPACHRVYLCNGFIELIELAERPDCIVMDISEDV